jgi:BolA family transcriptional regulator, general stress-responsive regulator
LTRPSVEEIVQRLGERMPGAQVEVEDDSHRHAGHAGAAGGAGHYKLRIVSPRFAGLPTLARHRLVYDCLSDWMPHRIHALSIVARSPDEGV